MLFFWDIGAVLRDFKKVIVMRLMPLTGLAIIAIDNYEPEQDDAY